MADSNSTNTTSKSSDTNSALLMKELFGDYIEQKKEEERTKKQLEYQKTHLEQHKKELLDAYNKNIEDASKKVIQHIETNLRRLKSYRVLFGITGYEEYCRTFYPDRDKMHVIYIDKDLCDPDDPDDPDELDDPRHDVEKGHQKLENLVNEKLKTKPYGMFVSFVRRHYKLNKYTYVVRFDRDKYLAEMEKMAKEQK